MSKSKLNSTVRTFRNANGKSRAIGHCTLRGSNRSSKCATCTYCGEVVIRVDADAAPTQHNVFARAYEQGHMCDLRVAYEIVTNRGFKLPVSAVGINIAVAGFLGAAHVVTALVSLVC